MNTFTKTKIKIKPAVISGLCVIVILSGQLIGASELSSPEIKLTNIVRGYSDRQLFGNPIGIFLDPLKGEIYLADAGNHQVGIFDLKGTTLWTFKHWVTDSRTGERMLGAPHSVVVNKNAEIIVSDNKADYLEVFDFRGTPLLRISPRDYDNVLSFRAAALALDNDGNLYIGTKQERSEIIKLDPEYELLMRFGEKGEDSSQFTDISGVWVQPNGEILVTDIFSSPVVKRFSPAGAFLGGFGGHTIEKEDFSMAAGIVTTRDGRIWIVDTLRQVVKCLTQNGEFITMIGGFGLRPGDMNYPSAIASDGDSLIIVAEKNGNRFQQFIIK